MLVTSTVLGQSPPPRQAAPAPTFRSTSTLVMVPALVLSDSGKLVRGLGASDFRLTDNGIEQKISVEVAEPQSLVVVVSSRFQSARKLMGYCGAFPREDSSGNRVRRGGITKAGNAFGDGTAWQISGLLDLSRTVPLPSNETFNKAPSRSKLCQDTRSCFPSADQLTPIKPFHPFTTRSRVWPVDVERSWILTWLEP
jgi:hypothetical protein